MGRGRPHRLQNETVHLIPQPKEQRSPKPEIATRNSQGAAALAAPCEERSQDNLWSLLEIGGHLLLELGEGGGAAQLLAVDKEGRRGLDIELLCRALAHVLDAIEDLLVFQTFIETCLTEAGLLADSHERLQGARHRPCALLLEQGLDHGEITLLAAAARQHERGGR